MDTQLNWDVISRPIFSNNARIDTHQALYRNDNDFLLNVCTNSYTPTRNERFLEIVQRMSDISGFPIECYDEFQGGKKVLAFLKATEKVEVMGHYFEDYMMIGNSHDGSTALFFGNSSKLIRCQNRFARQFQKLKVYHTTNQEVKISTILRAFEVYMIERAKLFSKLQDFSKVEIHHSIKAALVERLVNMTHEEKIGIEPISTKKQNIITGLYNSISTECEALGNNYFGLLQGVTHYTTHVRTNREDVFCNSMGGAARINEQAYNFCLENYQLQ